MKFATTGQEKGDLLIQVTTWAGLTVLANAYVFNSVVIGSTVKMILNKFYFTSFFNHFICNHGMKQTDL